jgi:hypothetical protein
MLWPFPFFKRWLVLYFSDSWDQGEDGLWWLWKKSKKCCHLHERFCFLALSPSLHLYQSLKLINFLVWVNHGSEQPCNQRKQSHNEKGIYISFPSKNKGIFCLDIYNHRNRKQMNLLWPWENLSFFLFWLKLYFLWILTVTVQSKYTAYVMTGSNQRMHVHIWIEGYYLRRLIKNQLKSKLKKGGERAKRKMPLNFKFLIRDIYWKEGKKRQPNPSTKLKEHSKISKYPFRSLLASPTCNNIVILDLFHSFYF